MNNLPSALAIITLGLALAGLNAFLIPKLLKTSLKRDLAFMDVFFVFCLAIFVSKAFSNLNLSYQASSDYSELFSIALLIYFIVFRAPKWEIHVKKEGLS